MARNASVLGERDLRELVQFYLLDHGTLPENIIDIALLELNLVFVGIFIVETYAVAADLRPLLRGLEVDIAFVFAVEYIARLYGAPDRTVEFFNGYTIGDLIAISPTLLVFLVLVANAGYADTVVGMASDVGRTDDMLIHLVAVVSIGPDVRMIKQTEQRLRTCLSSEIESTGESTVIERRAKAMNPWYQI